MRTPRPRRPGPPLLPPGRRPVLGAAVAVAVLVLGVLAVRFAGDATVDPVDRAIGRVLAARHGLLASLAQELADLGNPAPVAALLAALAVAAWCARRGRGLALALGGPTAAMVATSLVLKPLIGRTRDGGLSLPSGHTTAVASLALAAAIVLLGGPDVPGRARRAGGAALALVVAAVAVALVARGFHAASEVLAGLATALAVVVGVAAAVDRWWDRRTPAPDEGGGRAANAPPPGFEPGSSEPKSEVLPLHHGGSPRHAAEGTIVARPSAADAGPSAGAEKDERIRHPNGRVGGSPPAS